KNNAWLPRMEDARETEDILSSQARQLDID
ncbi:MAG: TRAP transporter permease DctQ, partial [Rhodospirillaceae bacterium]|nr:TRAP transporter permease DctQ [Rhodospirillaceae bacterium]